MNEDNRDKLVHILRNIAQRSRVNGDFRVREEDLNDIWNIVLEDSNGTKDKV